MLPFMTHKISPDPSLLKRGIWEDLQNEAVNVNQPRLSSSHRYKGLVDYIVSRYGSAIEIGVGHSPDVAFALLQKGMRVLATDIRSFEYSRLKVIMDNIIEPDFSLYIDADLIYSLRPPPELISYMIRLARRLSTDLIIKPLSSDYLEGQLIRHGNTTFFLWNHQ